MERKGERGERGTREEKMVNFGNEEGNEKRK